MLLKPTTINRIRVKMINFNVMYEEIVKETNILSVNINPLNQSVEVRQKKTPLEKSGKGGRNKSLH